MVIFMDKDSVGFVETQYFNINDSFVLDSGRTLDDITVAYETYGELNSDKTNAILICHALTGDAHAAGWHLLYVLMYWEVVKEQLVPVQLILKQEKNMLLIFQ